MVEIAYWNAVQDAISLNTTSSVRHRVCGVHDRHADRP